jgi:hypothetical protein
VHNGVAEVDEQPAADGMALHARGFQAVFFARGLVHGLSQGLQLTLAGARADDKVIGK